MYDRRRGTAHTKTKSELMFALNLRHIRCSLLHFFPVDWTVYPTSIDLGTTSARLQHLSGENTPSKD